MVRAHGPATRWHANPGWASRRLRLDSTIGAIGADNHVAKEAIGR